LVLDEGSEEIYVPVKPGHDKAYSCGASYIFSFLFAHNTGGIFFSWCLPSHSALIQSNYSETKMPLLEQGLMKFTSEGKHYILWWGLFFLI
jgi:hypothetical protein